MINFEAHWTNGFKFSGKVVNPGDGFGSAFIISVYNKKLEYYCIEATTKAAAIDIFVDSEYGKGLEIEPKDYGLYGFPVYRGDWANDSFMLNDGFLSLAGRYQVYQAGLRTVTFAGRGHRPINLAYLCTHAHFKDIRYFGMEKGITFPADGLTLSEYHGIQYLSIFVKGNGTIIFDCCNFPKEFVVDYVSARVCGGLKIEWNCCDFNGDEVGGVVPERLKQILLGYWSGV